MKIIRIILLFCLLLPLCSAVKVVEFCPDTYLPGDPDEYVVLEGSGLLDAYTLSDGEGGYRFPPGSTINGRITIARNGSAYTLVHGRTPDYEIHDYSPAVPEVISNGRFELGNLHDELMLYENNRIVQRIAWPENVTPREGQVHYFESGRWDPRVLMLGQSRLVPVTWSGVTGLCFVTPDCSLEVYIETIGKARNEVLINIYEFTSPGMTDALISAHKRGVNVTVLIEGGPVGGISTGEEATISQLVLAGIPVFLMKTTGVNHAPYRFDHAKYIVVDSWLVLITSENFTDNGFPEPGIAGNRGWGIVLDGPGPAAYFRELFLSDLNGKGIGRTGGKPGVPSTGPSSPHVREFSPAVVGGMNVTPVIAPDTSYLIGDLIQSASHDIDIEQAYISNDTGGVPNPYLSDAINASRHGIRVRVLLDSYWYNTDGESDNDEMVAYINRVAHEEGLPLEARCAVLNGNEIEKIHNKGVIVDCRKVLISSVNWNHNSPTFNREAGVIIDQPEAGMYFKRAFDDDWNASEQPEHGERKEQDLKLAIGCLVIVVLLVIYWKKRRIQ